ncbi:16956_t:CDS:2 [Gigaspora margarita]|uniref:16956_t:CDS:1 n=1 Tax=Gigaspora margarita TaxID=4874 RepID=A0ABM8VW68_GIGMA|nr:16956_t:CDS:2 [Gigaspora margarita]
MSKVQQWLESQEEYNTEEKRGKVKELDISKKDLEGALDLSDFINLEKLNCACNQLSAVNLSNCSQLKYFDCSFNKLINLNLVGLNQLKKISCNDNYLTSIDYYSINFNLTYLNVSNNNLSEQDLSIFSKLTNLEFLRIGGSNEKYFSQNICNKFYGTLEPLKNLTKLRLLDISNTDINSGVSEIYLNEKDLEGELDLEDFRYLRFVYISRYIDETRLEIKNKPEGADIIKLVAAQDRNEIVRLSISEKGLEGDLDLSDFVSLTILNCQGNKLTNLNISKNVNLVKLRCFNNKLTNLDVGNNQKLTELQCYAGCKKLKILNCHDNYLANLDYSSLLAKQLIHLDIRDNNLLEQDLSVFIHLVSLEKLYIGNVDENRIQQNIYNRFVGSLSVLVSLTKLERLDVSNTDIENGLKYLSNTIQDLKCSTRERPESKKQQLLFTEQAENIKYLEIRVQELTKLIKIQKRKLFDVFTRLLPEKKEELELMKNLIIVHLEYVKISKKRLLSVQLRRQRDKIRDELENKLGDDLVEEIQRVLDDCEELLLLIERHKQNPILQITDDRKKDELIKKRKIIEKEEKTNQSQLQQLKEQKQNSLITQLQKRLARVEGKLETKEEEVRYLRKVLINPIADYEIYSNKNSLNKLIGQFEEEPVLNQGGQEILGKIKDILGIKRIFLNMRQETIRELQNCYNDFKSSSRKHTKVKEVNRIMSAMGGVANSLTFGIPKALGDTIEEINNSFKRKFSDK